VAVLIWNGILIGMDKYKISKHLFEVD